MTRGMYEATEYLAIPRNRLYQITVMLFVLGCLLGLIGGYLLWGGGAEPQRERERDRPPRHVDIGEAR